MNDISPEEMLSEFKQYLKKTRLDEIEKIQENKAAAVRKQIKKLLGNQDE